MLDYRYKKSVETCRAHLLSGSGKPTTEMNWETNTPRCRIYLVGYSKDCTWNIQTEWASHCLHPSVVWNFPDFDKKDKARNAFLNRGFLPSDAAKIVQAERTAKFIWAFLRRNYLQIAQQAKISDLKIQEMHLIFVQTQCRRSEIFVSQRTK